ncbi:MAG: cbb3-type cytochrome oxidase assembly protein CcoS [Verrucomicrobiota bacterium]
MSVILLLIPLSLLLAGLFLAAFFWAVRSGQYEDTCTPSMRMLADDAPGRRGGALQPEERECR